MSVVQIRPRAPYLLISIQHLVRAFCSSERRLAIRPPEMRSGLVIAMSACARVRASYLSGIAAIARCKWPVIAAICDGVDAESAGRVTAVLCRSWQVRPTSAVSSVAAQGCHRRPAAAVRMVVALRGVASSPGLNRPCPTGLPLAPEYRRSTSFSGVHARPSRHCRAYDDRQHPASVRRFRPAGLPASARVRG